MNQTRHHMHRGGVSDAITCQGKRCESQILGSVVLIRLASETDFDSWLRMRALLGPRHSVDEHRAEMYEYLRHQDLLALVAEESGRVS